jgi:hypothetical protein
MLHAMSDASRQFRALERGTFPPDEEGQARYYIDDPAFVTELVGIYSSMAARADFDRLLEVLRAFPDGEGAYFEARINDALRRGDREGALVVIDEATASALLSEDRRERFVALLQTMRDEMADGTTALDRLYLQLQTAFDEAPETLRPQAFFALATMSLDRENPEQARQIMERLRQLEGRNGTNWRYIQVRLMLDEQDPDYAEMRRIQEDIAGLRPGWDMAYILRALIEERYLVANPGDETTIATLIEAYRLAADSGNRNPDVWQRLVGLLEISGRVEEATNATRLAALHGIALATRTGQFPQPFARMFSQVQEEIANEDATEADRIARQMIELAEMRGDRAELIFALNLVLGNVFLDAEMFHSAIRHLSVTAKSGGNFIYPLALAVARAGDIDGGFTLLLDEIDLVPSLMPTLLPTILVMMQQVLPSEAIFERIDRLMDRIERGERLTVSGTLHPTDADYTEITLGTRYVPFRRIQSFVIRFPEGAEEIDPAALLFIAPGGTHGEEELAER